MYANQKIRPAGKYHMSKYYEILCPDTDIHLTWYLNKVSRFAPSDPSTTPYKFT